MREDELDLNLLPYFFAVAESGSFAKAASRLGVPRPTVSRAIARLEREVGARLLQRTTRHVALSTTGSSFYDRVAPRFADLRNALGDMPERQEQPSGRLRVTAAVDVGAAVLAEMFTRFIARHPAIELEVHLTNRMVDLVAEGFDAGLRVSTTRLKDSSLSAKSLGPFMQQVFASPAHVARFGLPKTVRDAETREWVRFRNLETIVLHGGRRQVTLRPAARLICDEMFFVREALRSGAGLGLLPTFLADADVAAGLLVRVLPSWSAQSGQAWFVTPSSRQTPRKVLALREFLLEALRLRPLAASPME